MTDPREPEPWLKSGTGNELASLDRDEIKKQYQANIFLPNDTSLYDYIELSTYSLVRCPNEHGIETTLHVPYDPPTWTNSDAKHVQTSIASDAAIRRRRFLYEASTAEQFVKEEEQRLKATVPPPAPETERLNHFLRAFYTSTSGQRTATLPKITIITTTQVLLRLYKFAQKPEKKAKSSWRIELLLINDLTLLLFEHPLSVSSRRVQNYWAGFMEKFTEQQTRGDGVDLTVASHHRAVQYEVGGFFFIVLTEVDALVNNTATSSSGSSRENPEIAAFRKGQQPPVPHSTVSQRYQPPEIIIHNATTASQQRATRFSAAALALHPFETFLGSDAANATNYAPPLPELYFSRIETFIEVHHVGGQIRFPPLGAPGEAGLKWREWSQDEKKVNDDFGLIESRKLLNSALSRVLGLLGWMKGCMAWSVDVEEKVESEKVEDAATTAASRRKVELKKAALICDRRENPLKLRLFDCAATTDGEGGGNIAADDTWSELDMEMVYAFWGKRT